MRHGLLECGSHGPLKVVRIPMPPRSDDHWRTYTNVFFANGLILAPAYGDLDPAGQRNAHAILQRHMPGWRVVGIEVSGLIANGGALHCISMNAPRLTRWPTFRLSPATPTRPPGPVATLTSTPRVLGG